MRVRLDKVRRVAGRDMESYGRPAYTQDWLPLSWARRTRDRIWHGRSEEDVFVGFAIGCFAWMRRGDLTLTLVMGSRAVCCRCLRQCCISWSSCLLLPPGREPPFFNLTPVPRSLSKSLYIRVVRVRPFVRCLRTWHDSREVRLLSSPALRTNISKMTKRRTLCRLRRKSRRSNSS